MVVGDIDDEHDDDEVMFKQVSDDVFVADARVELEDVGTAVDPRLAETEDDVDTLGGLAAVLAGRVPQVGECVDHPSGWKLEVTDSDERRVNRLRLHPPVEPEPAEAD